MLDLFLKHLFSTKVLQLHAQLHNVFRAYREDTTVLPINFYICTPNLADFVFSESLSSKAISRFFGSLNPLVFPFSLTRSFQIMLIETDIRENFCLTLCLWFSSYLWFYIFWWRKFRNSCTCKLSRDPTLYRLTDVSEIIKISII